MNILGITNGRGQRLVNFHDFRSGGKEGNELGNFGFGQAESLEEPGVVKNPFHFFEHGGGKNKPMAAIKKFEEESFRRSRCPLICPDKNC
jgi:hypothetical protein